MKKILFIEDETDQIMMMQTRLEAYGYEFTAALDGEEGIQKAIELKPDIILLDIVMPKMNGYQVCAELKKNPDTCDIPIIVITASGARDLEQRCKELQVQEIIRKPYESSHLAERIAYYLAH